jgi:hypothetical protein
VGRATTRTVDDELGVGWWWLDGGGLGGESDRAGLDRKRESTKRKNGYTLWETYKEDDDTVERDYHGNSPASFTNSPANQ